MPTLDTVTQAPVAIDTLGKMGRLPTGRFSTLALLLQAIQDDRQKHNTDERRLHVVAGANVLHLKTERGYVTELLVEVEGQVHRLPVDPTCAVILAANTVHSTRLALMSFPRSVNDATAELIGRNLMAHTRSNLMVRVRRACLGLPPSLKDNLFGALHVEGATGHGRFHLQMIAASKGDEEAEVFLYSMMADRERWAQVARAQHKEWITLIIRIVAEMHGCPRIPAGPTDPTSHMRLSPTHAITVGQLSTPQVYVHLEPCARDLALWAEAERTAFDLVHQLADGDAANVEYLYGKPEDPCWHWYPEPPPLDFYRDGLGTSYHEAGTLWMGDDPDRSVTDVNGRLHHVANAYCVGQALFPTVGSANPVLTGLTLTQKVVEHLLDTHTPQAARQPVQRQSGRRRRGRKQRFDCASQWAVHGAGGYNQVPPAERVV
jgi:choline dehydrogenase-like flavoprotein